MQVSDRPINESQEHTGQNKSIYFNFPLIFIEGVLRANLEFERAALARRDEVVRDSARVVELGHFDGEREAVRVRAAVAHDERAHVLRSQHLQRDFSRDSGLVPRDALQLLVVEQSLRVTVT